MDMREMVTNAVAADVAAGPELAAFYTTAVRAEIEQGTPSILVKVVDTTPTEHYDQVRLVCYLGAVGTAGRPFYLRELGSTVVPANVRERLTAAAQSYVHVYRHMPVDAPITFVG